MIRPAGWGLVGNGRSGQGSLEEAPVLSGFFLSNLRFGILQRYVLGEIVRAFSLALLTVTAVFVLLTVMTKAASAGLGPMEILQLIPYMIPASLPYTVPVSLLFASTVVYGRLAGDNEVIAVKTAGLSAMVLIWPTLFLALALSLTLNYLSATFIPESTASVSKLIYKNIEDLLYKKLKMDKYAEFPQWVIKVKDVEGKRLLGPTFKQRAEKRDQSAFGPPPAEGEDQAAYSMVIQSQSAEIRFDFEREMAHVYFIKANIVKPGIDRSEANVNETGIDIPMPSKGGFGQAPMVESMTVAEMNAKKAEYLDNIATARLMQAYAAAWYIGSGRPGKVDWGGVNAAYSKFDYWRAEILKFDTEIQTRQAMAWGSLFFVILGAPVGILFARRDFLSAFISCFMPIILLYYPLMLFGMNLGKEGIIPPELVWSGNVVLWVIAIIWALPPVRKH
jgi:lipopolysaccharide export system permease protein